MSDFLLQCPTVPVVRGSEVRFSADMRSTKRVFDWPFEYVSCGEVILDQPRIQWGVPTEGARHDGFTGFRLGSEENNLTLGARSTSVSSKSRIAAAEEQRVGVASLTLGGRLQFRYWNDHAFWWWPMADGGDKGDTAGVLLGYNLAPHQLSIGEWDLQFVNLTMRLATGIPDRSSAVPSTNGQIYTRIEFPEIQRADLGASLHLRGRNTQRLEIGFTVDTDEVGHGVQNVGVHRTLGIPELPKQNKVEVQVFIRLTNW